MKNILLIMFMLIIFLIPINASAEECCLNHGTVDCSKIQADGRVICSDGWFGSACKYSALDICKNSRPTIIHQDINTVYGCTDKTAKNYDPNAQRDDGSCIKPILGCMDKNARNYNELANEDDNSCKYSTPKPSNDINNDNNQEEEINNKININDVAYIVVGFGMGVALTTFIVKKIKLE